MDMLSRDFATLLRDPAQGIRMEDRGDRIVIEGRAGASSSRYTVVAAFLVAVAALGCLVWLRADLMAVGGAGLVVSIVLSAIAHATTRRRDRRALVLEPDSITLEEGRIFGSDRRRIAYRDIRAIDVCDASDTPLARQHGLRSIGRYHIAVWTGPFRLRALSTGDPDSAERLQQGIIAAIGEVRMRARRTMTPAHTV